jgi:hypothetical protein
MCVVTDQAVIEDELPELSLQSVSSPHWPLLPRNQPFLVTQP